MEYPTCHPQIITKDFDWTLKSYLGLVKCAILPPRGKYSTAKPSLSFFFYPTLRAIFPKMIDYMMNHTFVFQVYFIQCYPIVQWEN